MDGAIFAERRRTLRFKEPLLRGGQVRETRSYIVAKYAEHKDEYAKEMGGYLKEGKVKYKEHVSKGIESFPTAFVELMTGHNVGKSVIRVQDTNPFIAVFK